jgi:prepilin-type N-terminal cleavage/methylation domain-containing protein
MKSTDAESVKDRPNPAERSPIINHQLSIINSRGFTLIELLVVIAIISLLMAILIPALERARKQARAMVCQSRLRQWSMTLAMYADDNQGHLPSSTTEITSLWLLRGTFFDRQDPNSTDETARYHFGTRGIALCPMTAKPSGKGSFPITYDGTLIAAGTYGSTLGTWEMTTPPPAFRGSYGYNDWLFKGFAKLVPPTAPALDVFSMRGRREIPLMLDSASPSMQPKSADKPPASEDVPTSIMGLICMNRHSGCVNGLFLDWSVRRVGLKELWTLKWASDFDRAGLWTKAGGAKPDAWPAWMRKFKDY